MERDIAISDTLAKQDEKSGTKMTNERMIVLIRSRAQKFEFSRSPNSKTIIVTIN